MRFVLVAVLLVACGGSSSSPGDGQTTDTGPDATPPTPMGCVNDVSTGDHTYTCGGLMVDARIPAKCQAPGCGLILVLHGDTGNGLLMDGHVKMRELGEQYGFVVVAPTGPPYGGGQPGSTWRSTNDATLIQIVNDFSQVFRVDAKNIHVTGFSRGAFVTWRLLCDHSDLFASAAPAGAGFGGGFGEVTCFQNGRAPARKLPIIFLMGRTDVSVGYQNMVAIRDAAIANYAATGPTNQAMDANYRHDRWMGANVIETFDHAYETVQDGPWASARGHCIAGSTTDPYAPQYAIPCKLPNAFVWGEEVMRFFRAHPMP
jgi:prepilin-type processing-associated H-X9-DG protein